MNQKSRLLVFIIIIFVSVAITILTINSLVQNNNKICGNKYISFVGKWKLVNTTRFGTVVSNNNCNSTYSIEFSSNGACKELIDCSNNTWEWKKYTSYDDYIIFGDNELPESGNFFSRIYYEITNKGSFLSLNYIHVNSLKNYEKVI